MPQGVQIPEHQEEKRSILYHPQFHMRLLGLSLYLGLGLLLVQEGRAARNLCIRIWPGVGHSCSSVYSRKDTIGII